MIGTAAALLMFFNGRIAGISGILGGALTTDAGELVWRLAFLAGLVLGPLAVALAAGTATEINPQGSVPVLALAGLCVGFGTRLGNGCTSGHGVCGLALGSKRSISATATFFVTAMATVFLSRHVIGG